MPSIYEFSHGGENYRLWAWKGDYLNLGAGAELGIYRQMSTFGMDTPHWLVDTSLALPMSMTVKDNNNNLIASYNPPEPQWWITSFNRDYQNKLAENLRVSFTVNFSGNKGMFNSFYNAWNGKKDNPWTFDKKNYSATLNI